MITLKQTCYACPEQYDAFEDGQKVGYLRLRHGCFTVSAPDHGGAVIYEGFPQGDGMFEDEERDFYLRFAVDAIQRWLAPRAIVERMPPINDAVAPDVTYEYEPR